MSACCPHARTVMRPSGAAHLPPIASHPTPVNPERKGRTRCRKKIGNRDEPTIKILPAKNQGPATLAEVRSQVSAAEPGMSGASGSVNAKGVVRDGCHEVQSGDARGRGVVRQTWAMWGKRCAMECSAKEPRLRPKGGGTATGVYIPLPLILTMPHLDASSGLALCGTSVIMQHEGGIVRGDQTAAVPAVASPHWVRALQESTGRGLLRPSPSARVSAGKNPPPPPLYPPAGHSRTLKGPDAGTRSSPSEALSVESRVCQDARLLRAGALLAWYLRRCGTRAVAKASE